MRKRLVISQTKVGTITMWRMQPVCQINKIILNVGIWSRTQQYNLSWYFHQQHNGMLLHPLLVKQMVAKILTKVALMSTKNIQLCWSVALEILYAQQARNNIFKQTIPRIRRPRRSTSGIAKLKIPILPLAQTGNEMIQNMSNSTEQYRNIELFQKCYYVRPCLNIS